MLVSWYHFVKSLLGEAKKVKEKQPLFQSDCFKETGDIYETVNLKSIKRADSCAVRFLVRDVACFMIVIIAKISIV